MRSLENGSQQNLLLQNEWKVGEAKKVVNFDPWIYATHSERLAILEEDLSTYFAECLMLSTAGNVTLDKEKGFLHKSGVAYRDLTKGAVKHYSSNPDAVERFEAEGLGFERAQELVEYFMKIGAPLPPFIIGSPPGNVYDVGEKHSKSMTYVAVPLGYDDLGRPLYKLIAIPTKEISVSDHWSIENEVSNIQKSLQILGMVGVENSAIGLVQLPALLEDLPTALKRLAKALQFESWDDIESDIRTSSLLEIDNDRTSIRRKSMLNWATRTIRQLVADGQPRSEFESFQETIRQVFAAERGGKYATDEYIDSELVVLEMEQLFVGNGGNPEYAKLFVKQNLNELMINESNSWVYGDLSYRETVYLLAQRVRGNVMGWIRGNVEAFDSYVGTGCGGGGSRNDIGFDRFDLNYENPTYSGFDTVNNYQTNDTVESASSPDDIVVTLDSGETYVLKIRDGWECNGEGCDKVSSHQSRVRIGVCHICEFCDPNVHKAE